MPLMRLKTAPKRNTKRHPSPENPIRVAQEKMRAAPSSGCGLQTQAVYLLSVQFRGPERGHAGISRQTPAVMGRQVNCALRHAVVLFRPMPEVTFRDLQKGLRDLGLGPSSRVVVHASLPALGP